MNWDVIVYKKSGFHFGNNLAQGRAKSFLCGRLTDAAPAAQHQHHHLRSASIHRFVLASSSSDSGNASQGWQLRWPASDTALRL